MSQRFTFLLYVIGIVLITTSCATVFGGYKNKLVVEEVPGWSKNWYDTGKCKN
jgi:hypothetical protein